MHTSTGVPEIQILCVVQVFFPAETPDQSLPRWFFDRSPSEVKAAFLAKRNNDQLNKVRLILSDFLFMSYDMRLESQTFARHNIICPEEE